MSKKKAPTFHVPPQVENTQALRNLGTTVSSQLLEGVLFPGQGGQFGGQLSGAAAAAAGGSPFDLGLLRDVVDPLRDDGLLGQFETAVRSLSQAGFDRSQQDLINTLESTNALESSTTSDALARAALDFESQLAGQVAGAGFGLATNALQNRLDLFGLGLGQQNVNFAQQQAIDATTNAHNFAAAQARFANDQAAANSRFSIGGLFSGGIGGAIGGSVFSPIGTIAGGIGGGLAGGFGGQDVGSTIFQSGLLTPRPINLTPIGTGIGQFDPGLSTSGGGVRLGLGAQNPSNLLRNLFSFDRR